MRTSAASPMTDALTRCCLAALMLSRMLPGSHVDKPANSSNTCNTQPQSEPVQGRDMSLLPCVNLQVGDGNGGKVYVLAGEACSLE